MSKKPQNHRMSLLAFVLTLCGALLVCPSATVQADQPDQPKAANQEQSSDANSTSVADEHAEDESPALGVIVGSCPGDAVCIKDTVWGSPADEAGLREGDYILSVDGTKVTSPIMLKQTLEKLEPGKKVTVTVWRSGEESEKEITLASKADKFPASHKAWLGVMLTPADDTGVMIERVLPGSPAAEAGLQNGDTIIKRDDKQVSDIQSFIESIEDQGPDSEIKLTVMRNGTEQQIPVTLGDKDQAPMRFMRQAMRPLMDDSRMSPRQDGASESYQLLDETIDQMREQIRELERQVRELKGDQDLSLRSKARDVQGVQEFPADQTLVVQRGRNNRNWNRGRNWDNDYYDWRNRNYRSYRTPLYRSPYYGNSYYRYGGRPYYGNYGRGYGWGRSGIQLGNFGVYWY